MQIARKNEGGSGGGGSPSAARYTWPWPPGVSVCERLGVSEILAVGDRMGNNCVPSPEGESAAKRSERTSDSDSLALRQSTYAAEGP